MIFPEKHQGEVHDYRWDPPVGYLSPNDSFLCAGAEVCYKDKGLEGKVKKVCPEEETVEVETSVGDLEVWPIKKLYMKPIGTPKNY